MRRPTRQAVILAAATRIFSPSGSWLSHAAFTPLHSGAGSYRVLRRHTQTFQGFSPLATRSEKSPVSCMGRRVGFPPCFCWDKDMPLLKAAEPNNDNLRPWSDSTRLHIARLTPYYVARPNLLPVVYFKVVGFPHRRFVRRLAVCSPTGKSGQPWRELKIVRASMQSPAQTSVRPYREALE